MLTSLNSATGKKDLHVGGIGENAPASLASVVDPLMEASENWVQRARDMVSRTDEFVRNNPWQALGVVALVGVTVGYLLSRGLPVQAERSSD